MKLYEEGALAWTSPSSIPARLEGTNKALVLRDIMAHRAGLTDWIRSINGWAPPGVARLQRQNFTTYPRCRFSRCGGSQ